MVADAFGVCVGLTGGILIRLNGRVRSLFSNQNYLISRAKSMPTV
jgi:hypothetical protein